MIAESVNYVRDLVVGPSNIVTALYFANEAKKIAKPPKSGTLAL